MNTRPFALISCEIEIRLAIALNIGHLPADYIDTIDDIIIIIIIFISGFFASPLSPASRWWPAA